MKTCKFCGEVVEELIDPCMYKSHGWYHVKATDNHSEGHYVFECGDGDIAEVSVQHP